MNCLETWDSGNSYSLLKRKLKNMLMKLYYMKGTNPDGSAIKLVLLEGSRIVK